MALSENAFAFRLKATKCSIIVEARSNAAPPVYLKMVILRQTETELFYAMPA